MTPSKPARHGGRVLADQLRILGVDAVFTVPGESFLPLLDGLHDHRDAIRTITCRHESGAANMADAHAKLTGRPAVVAVTRGPGATNASNGLHTAFQDSTPMIVIVGQVGRDIVDREAFQEMDYRRVFGEMAKWVAEIGQASRIPEYLGRAWATATGGRPGPVVLAVPEDVMHEVVSVADARPPVELGGAPDAGSLADLETMLAAAERPLLAIGGPGWSARCAALVARVAEQHGLPVASTFRSQDYIDNDHAHFVGTLGIAPDPRLRDRVRNDVDLLIVVGARLGEITTQRYSLVDIPNPQMRLVHVLPGPEELGRVYRPDLAVVSRAEPFLEALVALPTARRDRSVLIREMRAEHLDYRTPVTSSDAVNMCDVVAEMRRQLPGDAIVTNGAGNYTVWLHRFFSHRVYRTQLAPTSGSMGYAVPAAIAAKLAAPERVVVSFAGDGCFQMSLAELATAAQYGVAVVFVVVNNGSLGTIRMHQERHYPGRVVATDLTNPDFVRLAGAYGALAERVARTEHFAPAFARALAADGMALIEIATDPERLTPTQTVADARSVGGGAGRRLG